MINNQCSLNNVHRKKHRQLSHFSFCDCVVFLFRFNILYFFFFLYTYFFFTELCIRWISNWQLKRSFFFFLVVSAHYLKSKRIDTIWHMLLDRPFKSTVFILITINKTNIISVTCRQVTDLKFQTLWFMLMEGFIHRFRKYSFFVFSNAVHAASLSTTMDNNTINIWINFSKNLP